MVNNNLKIIMINNILFKIDFKTSKVSFSLYVNRSKFYSMYILNFNK